MTEPVELSRMERGVISIALRKYREHLLHYARANPAQEHLASTTGGHAGRGGQRPEQDR